MSEPHKNDTTLDTPTTGRLFWRRMPKDLDTEEAEKASELLFFLMHAGYINEYADAAPPIRRYLMYLRKQRKKRNNRLLILARKKTKEAEKKGKDGNEVETP